jgi:regulator of protease activity HflC (stomatin/prohibitin superfamily)
MDFSEIVAVLAVIAALSFVSSIKILAEYERAVIFRLGRLLPKEKGPGIILVYGPVDRMIRVSLRQEAIEVPGQEGLTRDNFLVKVNAVVFLRVVDARRAVVEVSNYVYQTSQFAQVTLRGLLAEVELDQLLKGRDQFNARLQSTLDAQTSPWGVRVACTEIKQVEPPAAALRGGQLVLEGDLLPTINRKVDLILNKLSVVSTK